MTCTIAPKPTQWRLPERLAEGNAEIFRHGLAQPRPNAQTHTSHQCGAAIFRHTRGAHRELQDIKRLDRCKLLSKIAVTKPGTPTTCTLKSTMTRVWQRNIAILSMRPRAIARTSAVRDKMHAATELPWVLAMSGPSMTTRHRAAIVTVM